MFIDASALTSMFVAEVDAPELLTRLRDARSRIVSPLVVWETAAASVRIVGFPVAEITDELHDYLDKLGIENRAVPPEASRLALEAFDRYGKGRHPAGLNFGDCFSYACARHFDEPLLFKGRDFSLTDIERA